MKKMLLLFLAVLLLSNVFALCNETQININSASLEELDKITGIGPAYAQKIIQDRPFSSVDDLIKVSGIGNKTLDKIKQQGLACVDKDTTPEIPKSSDNDLTETEENETKNNKPENKTIYARISNSLDVNYPKKEITIINLTSENSKSIKSNENKENLTISIYALAGIIAFCVVFGLIFLLKKRKEKNELQ